MVLCLGAADQHPSLRPVYISPCQREMLAGAAKASEAAQSKGNRHSLSGQASSTLAATFRSTRESRSRLLPTVPLRAANGFFDSNLRAIASSKNCFASLTGLRIGLGRPVSCVASSCSRWNLNDSAARLETFPNRTIKPELPPILLPAPSVESEYLEELRFQS